MVILADSGSTHIFLASETAKQLGYVIQVDTLMRVTAANRSNLMSYHSCPQFKWKMQGIEFEHKLRMLDIGGCDMVLRVDWMIKHNPILFDFIGYKLQVSVKGKRVELKGFSKEGNLQSMSAAGVKQLLKKGQLLWSHLFIITAQPTTEEISIPEQIGRLLTGFPGVFAEPKSLPPQRSHDHFIPLKSDAAPVSIRPYMYNHFQKNEIEKQVTDMLNNGTIQPSHSPFSSPVLLVKKRW